MTTYGLNSQNLEEFSLQHCVKNSCMVSQPSIQWKFRCLFPEVKEPGTWKWLLASM